jgi:hypothetical protein
MKRSLGVLLGLTLIVVPAEAKKKDKGDKHEGHDRDREHVDVDVNVNVRFSSVERERVQYVFVDTHGRGKCPPGLAKKNNGCLPPGHARKRYEVGKVLPREVVVAEVPKEIGARIGKAPAGYRYGMVDGDLVKLAVGTLLVVDAIDGLVD